MNLNTIERKIKKAYRAKNGEIRVYLYEDGIRTRTNAAGEVIETLTDKQWEEHIKESDDTIITIRHAGD